MADREDLEILKQGVDDGKIPKVTMKTPQKMEHWKTISRFGFVTWR